jgi:hypothetical protein
LEALKEHKTWENLSRAGMTKGTDQPWPYIIVIGPRWPCTPLLDSLRERCALLKR